MSISTSSRASVRPRIGRARRYVETIGVLGRGHDATRHLPALRILLGVLFIWFGALKVFGVSPVAALVSGTLPWANPRATVMVLGGAEVAFGIALVTGCALRLVLLLMAAPGRHVPDVRHAPANSMFRGDPFLLTETGEFVTKNLVLIAATVVLLCHIDTRTVGRSVDSAGELGITPLAPADPSWN